MVLESMYSVFGECPQIIGKEFFLAGGREQSAAQNQFFLVDKVGHEVGHRVEFAHEDCERGVVKDMDVSARRIELPDSKGPETPWLADVVHVADEAREDHQ